MSFDSHAFHHIFTSTYICNVLNLMLQLQQSIQPNHPSRMATSCVLDSLPTEIKILLLHQIPNVATLSALVHASPCYHSLYLALREEVLTSITFRELSARNVRIITPLSFAQVRVRGYGEPRRELQAALWSICDQAASVPATNPAASDQLTRTADIASASDQGSKTSGGFIRPYKMKLKVEHCLALLTIEDFIGWRPLAEQATYRFIDMGYQSDRPLRGNDRLRQDFHLVTVQNPHLLGSLDALLTEMEARSTVRNAELAMLRASLREIRDEARSLRRPLP